MSSKLLRRLLLAPVILFFGLELILWLFVRIPVEPLKTLNLENDLPGLKKEVRLVIDQYLARYLDNASGPGSSGTVRLLCLGGTGTFAMFQNAEDTWWGRLGRGLQAKGLNVEVAGWGQDRTGIVASTPVAAALMEDWQPDVVIANFGFDDVVGQPLEYQYNAEEVRSLPRLGRTAGWKQALVKVSQIARLRRKMARDSDAGQIENRIGRPDYWKETFLKMKKEVNLTAIQPMPARDPAQDPQQEFMDGWKVLQELCAAHGASLIMTGEASLHDSTNNLTQQENLLAMVPVKSGTGPDARYVRPDPAWVEREMARYAEAAEAFAAANKLPWLNLNGRIPRDLDHFFSDVILTDDGAAVMAKELLPIVEPVVQAKKK